MLCPVNAKFTALNGMDAVLNDPRVSIVVEAPVTRLDIAGTSARKVSFRLGDRDREVAAEHFVLGAGSLFNPVLLHQAGLSHPMLGKRLHEQLGHEVEVHLADIDALDGGTAATGLYCGLIDGPSRAKHGSVAYYFDNRWWRNGLRTELEKARRTFPLIINAEDLPLESNYVDLNSGVLDRPRPLHPSHSEYGEIGLRRGLESLEQVLEPLGVERIIDRGRRSTESHIQGTTVMGADPSTSIVDDRLLHHRVRNLSVVGTSVFPSCSTANPGLTAAALSLRAASLMS